MQQKDEIILCMGSSCFARGNKKMHALINDYLIQNSLRENVEFMGHHCLGNCSDGPNLKINSKVYGNINQDNIIEILDEELKKRK